MRRGNSRQTSAVALSNRRVSTVEAPCQYRRDSSHAGVSRVGLDLVVHDDAGIEPDRLPGLPQPPGELHVLVGQQRAAEPAGRLAEAAHREQCSHVHHHVDGVGGEVGGQAGVAVLALALGLDDRQHAAQAGTATRPAAALPTPAAPGRRAPPGGDVVSPSAARMHATQSSAGIASSSI